MIREVKELRKKFKKYNIDGYVVPKNDDYFTEYSKVNRLKIISNFSGSAGLAIVLKDKNYLFTDGRYTIQSEMESGKYFKIISYEKIINLDLSNKNLKVNSVKTNRVVKNQIKSTRISKKDIYTLTFYDADMEPIYKLGLGNPFEVRVQHIGFEEADNFMFDTPIKNYSVAIPIDIDASFVSINK